MTLTQITEKGIKDGEIVNADINASAAIQGSKIDPDFGSQKITTTGNIEIDSDSAELKLGDGQDFRLFHNGTDNKIIAQNGELLVQCQTYSLRNENGSATYATIDSTANVGIGTTSPLSGAKLTIASLGLAITGQNTAHSANSLRLGEEGSGLAQLRAYGPDTSSAGSFQFTTSTSNGIDGITNALRIAADGKVGIGTSSPTAPLTVHNSNDTTTNALEVYNDNGVRVSGFSQSSTGDATMDLRTNAASQTVLLRSNGNSYINGGNLGIGATSPSHVLDVRGASNTTFDHVSNIQILGTSAYDSNDAGAGINFGGIYNASGDLTTFAQISGIKADTGNGSYDGAITFGVRNDTSGMGLDIERLRIDADGNLKLRNVTTNHQAIQFYHNNNIGCSFSYGEGNANPTLNIYRADAQSGFPYGSLIINTGDGTNPTQALKLRTDKNIELAGNLIMASGKGIDFSDTAAPNQGTGTQELLDDYEEGTWTPVYGASAVTSSTYLNTVGRYTKVGRLVTVTGRIQMTASVVNTNNLTLGGFPYACSNTLAPGGIDITYSDNWYGGSSGDTAQVTFLLSGTVSYGYFYNGDGNHIGADDPYDGCKRTMHFKGQYETDS